MAGHAVVAAMKGCEIRGVWIDAICFAPHDGLTDREHLEINIAGLVAEDIAGGHSDWDPKGLLVGMLAADRGEIVADAGQPRLDFSFAVEHFVECLAGMPREAAEAKGLALIRDAHRSVTGVLAAEWADVEAIARCLAREAA
jgi:hypothetical protein